ncbi:MAG: hypothetical protein RLZZ15_4285 [Verrucomicrobiota bacterium]
MTKYLLDVNALLAWWHATAHGHSTFHAWAKSVGFKSLSTCALTELGFLRVSMQVFKLTLDEAQDALADIRKHAGVYVTAAPSPQLAHWATSGGRTSDAYLAQLAASAGLVLATFDHAIPGALVITPLPAR